MKQNLVVVKSNKVIEAGYRLTLNEQRLVLSCIAQIKKGQKVSADDRFEISAEDFAKNFKLSFDQAYRELQLVSERLYDRSVTILDVPTNNGLVNIKTRWISSIFYLQGTGKISLCFAAGIIPYISLLEANFTRYKLEAVANMKSIYGVRFYELFMQWQSIGKREIALSDLKKLLELEEQYSAIKDFKKYVIEPALRDINEYSDLEASYTQRKAGRIVSHLIFHFKPKPKTQPMANPKPKAKRITNTQIEKEARPGETYQDVLKRINKK